MKEKKIVSKQNSNIKALKKLSSKKNRHAEGRFMVENLLIIYDALRAGFDFETIFITSDFKNKHKEKFNYLEKNSKADFYLVDEKINKNCSELETPSGITAVYKIKTSSLEVGRSVVYLNGINDPGNLGTIMRTMLAFGFINLVVDGFCADIYNYKTISAAKDSIFKLNIEKDKTGDWIKENKYKLPIYVSNPYKGTDLEKFKSAKVFCLVLGSESHGVSDDITKIAKDNIRIEISKNIDSLNVSTATAILLYKLKKV